MGVSVVTSRADTQAVAQAAVQSAKADQGKFSTANKLPQWKPVGLKTLPPGIGDVSRLAIDNAIMESMIEASIDLQIEDLRQDMEADVAAQQAAMIDTMEIAAEVEVKREDAMRELMEVKAKCQKINRMSGQEQMMHCLNLLRSMSDLHSEDAKTFVHGWGCYILSHF